MKIDFPSEGAIEEFVCHRIRRDGVCPITGDDVSGFVRQHGIKGYGRTDVIKIIARSSGVTLVVLELKNKPMCADHVCQLARYMVGLRRQARRFLRRFGFGAVEVKGELAGPIGPRPGDWIYLSELMEEEISLYELSLDMVDGFSAEPSYGWHSLAEDMLGSKDLARRCLEAIKQEQAGGR